MVSGHFDNLGWYGPQHGRHARVSHKMDSPDNFKVFLDHPMEMGIKKTVTHMKITFF